MRRYVVEFANEIIKSAEAVRKTASVRQEDKDAMAENIRTVDRVVRLCERGFISEFEAMRELVRIVYKGDV